MVYESAIYGCYQCWGKGATTRTSIGGVLKNQINILLAKTEEKNILLTKAGEKNILRRAQDLFDMI